MATPTLSPTVSPETLPANSLLLADRATVQQKATENYNLAKQKALEWSPGARGYLTIYKLEPGLIVEEGTETYVFGSDQLPGFWYVVTLNRQSGKIVRAQIPKEDYLGTDLKPLQTSQLKKIYYDALLVAEQFGGAEFREQNTKAKVTISLSFGQPGDKLWWTVEYLAGAETKKILVNAADGSAVDEAGNPLATPTPSPGATTSPGGTTTPQATSTPEIPQDQLPEF